MARRESRMLELGTPALEFALPDPSGKVHRLGDFAASPVLLVAFICNHCPYVKHILGGFAAFARDYGTKGLAVVAINPNDAEAYPADGPAAMADVARQFGFTFPYLCDESQRVALAYQAICTPDFYLFDSDRRLVYRGQFDDSRPGGDIPVTGASLRSAVDALLHGRPVFGEQLPSVGCSIKWKPDNAPDWA